MRHLYMAGPYTRPDPIINTNAALRVATAIYEQRLYIPHVPHLTLLWHLVTPRPIEHWYGLDLCHMEMCQAFMRLPGDSTGADREADEAQRLGLTVIPFASLPEAMRVIWLDR